MSFSEFRRQRGSAAIEFVLVFGIFQSALLAMIDFSRWLFAINSAHEAAGEGARVAVVCNFDAAAIEQHMAPYLATAKGGSVSKSYVASPGGTCTAGDTSGCASITVSLSGYYIDSIAPFLPIALTLPTAKTFLSRESMDSTINPRCV